MDVQILFPTWQSVCRRTMTGLRFIVLTGDQVYTDATAGILDPSIRDGRYILPYNRWLQSRAVRTALRQVPSYMLLDEHEIEND
jgi:cholesterol oxidase